MDCSKCKRGVSNGTASQIEGTLIYECGNKEVRCRFEPKDFVPVIVQPCPFCKSSVSVEEQGTRFGEDTIIMCLGCGVRVHFEEPEDSALKRWNTR